jgi:hypothetical protein
VFCLVLVDLLSRRELLPEHNNPRNPQATNVN